ncbi:MAG: MFS transporter [Candidatus Aramenus sp.]|nr:MFS transporter [Candidatus Aramenus sp.]
MSRSKNFHLFTLLVFFTGLYLGIFRVAFPVLEINEYYFVLYSIIIFGFTKSFMNYVSGYLSDVIGRKKVLILGWLVSIPLPLIAIIVKSPTLVTLFTVLLGINQALTWTTTVTSQIDISGKRRAGLASGINETFGYLGVSIGNFISGLVISSFFSPYYLMLLAGLLALGFSNITSETKPNTSLGKGGIVSSLLVGIAGLLEKFVDAFFWVLVPLYLSVKGPLEISIIVTIYTLTWALLQIPFGYISDLKGRLLLLVSGFITMGIGTSIFMLQYYVISAFISGLGMAMVYPNLIAYVNDYCSDGNRGRSLGIYRLLRDSGYGFAGLIFLLTYKDLLTAVTLVVLLQLVSIFPLVYVRGRV